MRINSLNKEIPGIGFRRVRQHHAIALIDDSDPGNVRHIIGSLSIKPYKPEQLRALEVRAMQAGFTHLESEEVNPDQRIERLDPSLEQISPSTRHLRVMVEIHECTP